MIVDLPEDEYNERRRAFVHGRHKLIVKGNDQSFMLFDLEADPKEATDLAKTQKDLFTEVLERYKAVARTIADVPPKGGVPKH